MNTNATHMPRYLSPTEWAKEKGETKAPPAALRRKVLELRAKEAAIKANDFHKQAMEWSELAAQCLDEASALNVQEAS